MRDISKKQHLPAAEKRGENCWTVLLYLVAAKRGVESRCVKEKIGCHAAEKRVVERERSIVFKSSQLKSASDYIRENCKVKIYQSAV